jgi:hypothetical protein
MAGIAFGTGSAPELIWPGIAHLFGTSYEDYPTLYTKIFSVEKATKKFEKVQGMAGLGLAQPKTEGGSVAMTNLLQGFQKEYVMTAFGLGTSITLEMMRDEQYGYIKKVPGFLSKSMRHTEETNCFNVLNRAFNASYTGPDGIVLCATNHVLVGGGTASNRLTTDADLSQTSIEVMVQQLMDEVDDQSLHTRRQPKCLVVPTGLNFRARKILESSYVTGAADNDINPIPGLFSDLVVSPWLTDTDAFFVVTDAEGLRFWRRDATEIYRDNEFSTRNMDIAVYGRWTVSWDDFRAIVGTSGA